MPVKKAAFKALRQSKVRAQKNKKVKSDVVALVRKVRKSVVAKDLSKAQNWLKQVVKKIDKAVQNGVIKKNTAARQKSRLTKAVNALVRKGD
ncbi:MAG: 30S ribosomal protein S20 [Candidatus Buchananbacteria bacterium RIFCSPHIGHO2_02_FULL_38_8]|uniref:Small ribosomal subunit protein bS20 n=2 Tax=Candidatus Buchananiibacteriota TaxID=1817903 RepID=A0A1G1XUN1_9BACT|nr:MAG: 30S ribosomal protein S20 [Candidatus Buchananbacteria bacterium RIFCSPHIGHO2_01_FULL_39_8]OGY47919.1 MAG: 30S ribosomal protein S20 [Candidatus Buchananbacteria bacterium RIFCSPHIGHO2_02_FULL_38_8]